MIGAMISFFLRGWILWMIGDTITLFTGKEVSFFTALSLVAIFDLLIGSSIVQGAHAAKLLETSAEEEKEENNEGNPTN